MSDLNFCKSFLCNKAETQKIGQSNLTPGQVLQNFGQQKKSNIYLRYHQNSSNQITKSRDCRNKISIRQSMDEHTLKRQKNMRLDLSNFSNKNYEMSRQEALELKILLGRLNMK